MDSSEGDVYEAIDILNNSEGSSHHHQQQQRGGSSQSKRRPGNSRGRNNNVISSDYTSGSLPSSTGNSHLGNHLGSKRDSPPLPTQFQEEEEEEEERGRGGGARSSMQQDFESMFVSDGDGFQSIDDLLKLNPMGDVKESGTPANNNNNINNINNYNNNSSSHSNHRPFSNVSGSNYSDDEYAKGDMTDRSNRSGGAGFIIDEDDEDDAARNRNMNNIKSIQGGVDNSKINNDGTKIKGGGAKKKVIIATNAINNANKKVHIEHSDREQQQTSRRRTSPTRRGGGGVGESNTHNFGFGNSPETKCDRSNTGGYELKMERVNIPLGTSAAPKWVGNVVSSNVGKLMKHSRDSTEQQLINALKRLELYKNENELLHKQLDSGNISEEFSRLRGIIQSQSIELKQLAEENRSLVLVSKNQEKTLIQQELSKRAISSTEESILTPAIQVKVLIERVRKLTSQLSESRDKERYLVNEIAKATRMKVENIDILRKVIDTCEKFRAEIIDRGEVRLGSRDSTGGSRRVSTRPASQGSCEEEDAGAIASQLKLSILKIYTSVKLQKEAHKTEKHTLEGQLASSQSQCEKLTEDLNNQKTIFKKQTYDLKKLKEEYDHLLISSRTISMSGKLEDVTNRGGHHDHHHGKHDNHNQHHQHHQHHHYNHHNNHKDNVMSNSRQEPQPPMDNKSFDNAPARRGNRTIHHQAGHSLMSGDDDN